MPTPEKISLEQRLSTIEKRLQILDDQQTIIKLKAQYVNYNDGGREEQGRTHSYFWSVCG